MTSLWKKDVRLPDFAQLKETKHADVLIIGGGLTGILCAHYLHEQGVDCLLLEADRIGGGTTAGTTAKITAQHGLIYHRLLSRYGADAARGYYDANTEAIAEYRRLAETIDCDFVTTDNLIYSRARESIIDRELEALDKIGRSAALAENLPLPFDTKGAVKFIEQAMFHPRKFLAALAKDLPIYEQTPVLSVTGNTAITPQGRVIAENILITTHFPILNARGLYWLRLYQNRSYVLAVYGASPPSAMYMDEDESGLSFRAYEDGLILGGGAKRTGKPCGGFAPLERFVKKHYPKASIHYAWAAQDCMTPDGIPYIGQYATGLPHLYLATGFNKWGMTSAMVAARLLTDRILEKPNPYAGLFSPQRPPTVFPLLGNAAASVVGMLTPTLHRCTHLGCGLRYNHREHSWDCPCHGSRFAKRTGTVLEGPAKKPLSTKWTARDEE